MNTDFFQVTLLHLAAEGGHTDTVEYLVSKEADVNIKDKHGVSTNLPPPTHTPSHHCMKL